MNPDRLRKTFALRNVQGLPSKQSILISPKPLAVRPRVLRWAVQNSGLWHYDAPQVSVTSPSATGGPSEPQALAVGLRLVGPVSLRR
ncbi:hypothetical protein Pla52n_59570 [Stieleria varia]|uniref:Uncharacterized protein n=1 Tax=Stieleria varia TaxID=2528005 RepID=A0A5C6A1Y2_9BACT|nr:hypothetical protein Pla52n_59570 [Stieleria varia]